MNWNSDEWADAVEQFARPATADEITNWKAENAAERQSLLRNPRVAAREAEEPDAATTAALAWYDDLTRNGRTPAEHPHGKPTSEAECIEVSDALAPEAWELISIDAHDAPSPAVWVEGYEHIYGEQIERRWLPWTPEVEDHVRLLSAWRSRPLPAA